MLPGIKIFHAVVWEDDEGAIRDALEKIEQDVNSELQYLEERVQRVEMLQTQSSYDTVLTITLTLRWGGTL